MQSSSPKLVFLLGGLGNQLWLAILIILLNMVIARIDIRARFWFSFGKSRLKRHSYAILISLLVPKAIFSCSIISLLLLRLISLCRFLCPVDVFDRLLYRQDAKYVSDSFLISLSVALDQCVSFSSDHKAYLASMSALHLRLGDRGLTLSDDETFGFEAFACFSSQ